MSPSPPRPPTTRRATGVTSQFMLTGVSGRLATAAEPGGRLTYVDLRAGMHGAMLAGLPTPRPPRSPPACTPVCPQQCSSTRYATRAVPAVLPAIRACRT
ncbi:hypothetical protein [Micromonospora sp. WMMD1082]|uniref:hypothetical protein n=1 Tax=Micromonospora sp. WMMD1082 TaxID=3016104 RepID=UPI002416E302|nr:hypothetical protein [Micromonospora sp. WMMD1082]MDG4795480.1 hypothetical protein [Micromonospora sp. WMMD1082]